MEHFVRVVMEKQKVLEGLNESVFPNHNVFESEQGATIIEIPLDKALPDDIVDEFVGRLADHMFNEGYDDFDIEVSTDLEELDEITLDGDDFYHEYGELGYVEEEGIWEAEYRGRKVKLNKPMRGDVKKFKVYVKNAKGNVVKVNFGDKKMRIKKSNPKRRRSFRARHNCDNPGPKWKARYWSCRKW